MQRVVKQQRTPRLERGIAAAPEAVYRYFTEPELWARWQGVGAALDPQPGGRLEIGMGVEGGGAAGEYVTLDPPHRIVFSWGWVESPLEALREHPAGSTTVELDLIAADGGTLLRLTHYGLTPESELLHIGGWNRYLERLVAIAAGGEAAADRADGTDWPVRPELQPVPPPAVRRGFPW